MKRNANLALHQNFKYSDMNAKCTAKDGELSFVNDSWRLLIARMASSTVQWFLEASALTTDFGCEGSKDFLKNYDDYLTALDGFTICSCSLDGL